jgi:drug/metabolite transporter (DMT)-like permease
MKPSSIESKPATHLWADLALLGATVIWGSTFVAEKIALRDISPVLLVVVRFWLATLLVAALWLPRLRRMTPEVLRDGLVLGLTLFLGFLFQTIGLAYTTASRSGFITALTVIFVPFVVIMLVRKLPSLWAWIGVVLAAIGLWFFTQPKLGGINKGDFLTLLCAVSFAFQIALLEVYTRRHDVVQLLFLELLVTAVLSVPCLPLLEKPVLHLTPSLIWAVLFCATLATVGALYIQNAAQSRTSATRAAVIYTAEPVFAAFFSYLILSERFTLAGYFGAALILIAMLLSELGRA